MSVTEICARIEPSMNSTSECTVDWGWMVTRTLAGGRLKRRQASMISKPLFIMVAESMVMRWPITQVGCLSACAGVMCSNSAAGVERKGPPDAVSQICLTSEGLPPRRHWWTALCSESMGSSATLCLRAAARMSSPAATRHSLFARPIVLPAQTAA